MEKGMFVKDIKAGGAVSGVFVVLEASSSTTRRNELYWRILLGDKSGRLPGIIWPPASQTYQDIPAGILVGIEAQAEIFKESIQLNIRKLEFINTNLADWGNIDDFIPSGKYNPHALLKELRQLCKKELIYPPLFNLLESVLNDPDLRKALLLAPAAKSIHQAYAGGLLEHTLNVAKLCLAISDLYPVLDRQILLAGAILHDLGKIREYSMGFAIDCTQEGLLLGHIMLGLEIIAPYLNASDLHPELKEHLKHLVLSHHGEPQYGAARLPQTAEAFVLHYADNIDAKIFICLSGFAEDAERPAWSQRIPWLDRSVLLPVLTPRSSDALEEARDPNSDKKKDSGPAQGTLAGFLI